MAKRITKSKTFWFNMLVCVVGVAVELTPVIDQLVAAGFDAPWITAARSWLLFAGVIGNWLLRMVTTSPVTWR